MRRDKGDVCAGAAASASRVLERRLEHGAVFTIESAGAGLKVGDGGDERAVDGVGCAGREHATTLDECRRSEPAAVVEYNGVALSLSTNGSDKHDSESREDRLESNHCENFEKLKMGLK